MNEMIGYMGFASKYYMTGEWLGTGMQHAWPGLMVVGAREMGIQEHCNILSSLMYVQNFA